MSCPLKSLKLTFTNALPALLFKIGRPSSTEFCFFDPKHQPLLMAELADPKVLQVLDVDGHHLKSSKLKFAALKGVH